MRNEIFQWLPLMLRSERSERLEAGGHKVGISAVG